MKMLTKQKPVQKLPSRKANENPSPVQADNPIWANRDETSCACEGGCPACSNLQGKFEISQPGDRYEQEADEVAQHIMATESGQPVAAGHSVMPAPKISPLIQRACTACESCPSCKDDEKEEGEIQRSPEKCGPQGFSTSAAPSQPNPGPRALHHPVSGQGEPLPAGLQGFMQRRFQHDFNSVRVHHDSTASQTAQSIQAKAYTLGNHMVFGPSQYQPHSPAGQCLIAHELTHVVQQSYCPTCPLRTIYRTACGHDGESTNCGFGLGIMNLMPTDPEGTPTGEATRYNVDSYIVTRGIARESAFAGNWVAQVQTPPNPVKTGRDRGFVDGMKVNDAPPTLRVEIVEIKARSGWGGGCALATTEARGYQGVITGIAPKVVQISTALSAVGGFRITGGNTPANAAQRRVLETAGIDLSNPDWRDAWNFYNSLQNRRNVTYAAPFTSVVPTLNSDGSVTDVYDVLTFFIDCPVSRGGGVGERTLSFMTNCNGGISYGCSDTCRRSRRRQPQDQPQDQPVEHPTYQFRQVDPYEEPETDTPPQEIPETPPGETPEIPEQVPDTPQEVPIPPEGIPYTEIVVTVGGGLSALYALHRLARNRAEREAAQRLAEQVIRQMERVEPNIARGLDSRRIRQLGTDAYDDVLRRAESQTDDIIRRIPPSALARRFGPRAAETITRLGSRALIIVAVVMTASDAYALANNYLKGAEIEIGLGGGDVDLGGDTHVESHEPEGTEHDVTMDADLEDTQIDVEVTQIPRLEGSGSIEAENVTIRGGVNMDDGSPVSLNFTVRMQDTTIIIRHQGTIQGDQIVTGEYEITGSRIEYDLPEGTMAQVRANPDQPVRIQDVNIRVTDLSGGTGGQTGAVGSGQGGTTGTGEGTTPPPTAEETTPPVGGETTPPTTEGQAGSGGGGGIATTLPPEGTPTTTTPGPVAPTTPDRQALLQQVQDDPTLNRVYQTLVEARDEGPSPDEEFLTRFIALQPLLAARSANLEEIMGRFQRSAVTDPIQQIIVPLEQLLAMDEDQLRRELERQITEAERTTPVEPAPVEPTTEPPPTLDVATVIAAREQVREIRFDDLVRLGLENRFSPTDRPSTPPATVMIMMRWYVSGQIDFYYDIPADGTLIRAIPAAEGAYMAGRYRITLRPGPHRSNRDAYPIRITNIQSYEVGVGFWDRTPEAGE